MRSMMNYKLSTLALAALLTACGGGGGGGGNDSGTGNPGGPAAQGAVTLSGQVIDGPIAGAKVCLQIDGAAARDAANAAICSADTDAQGNYSLSVPRSLNAGLLTLVASKGSSIKLVSTLGTLEQVIAAAGSSSLVTAANLPAARVTHFTTADFVLADSNHDGVLSSAERAAYVPSVAAAMEVAAVIKAVVDFNGQAGGLLGGATNDTLQLAAAAAQKKTLGSTQQTAAQWLALPANANIAQAVLNDLTLDAGHVFARYQFTGTVVAESIPAPTNTVVGGMQASLYCTSPGESETEVVELALNARLGIAVVRQQDNGLQYYLVGDFNPSTGDVLFSYAEPRHVSLANSVTTYYSESFGTLRLKLDAQSGSLTGTSSDSVTNSWTLDASTKTCTAESTFKGVKL